MFGNAIVNWAAGCAIDAAATVNDYVDKSAESLVRAGELGDGWVNPNAWAAYRPSKNPMTQRFRSMAVLMARITIEGILVQAQAQFEAASSFGLLPSRSAATEGIAGATRSAPGAATEAAGGVDTGLVHGPPLGRPNFIASANGEIVAVPDSAVGPTMADSGNGIQFTGGSGGRGLDPRVTDIRVMEPVTTGKYTYPDGYVSYSNAAGQTVSPITGQTIGKSDPFWHWQWGPR